MSCLLKLRKTLHILRPFQSLRYSQAAKESVTNSTAVIDEDMPVEMENPYTKENPKCILCRYNIEVDYKNVRLLSQFLSRYTGRIYGRHITGLCKNQQRKVEVEIKKAQNAGLMAVYLKDPNFFRDPSLYDETNPLRRHKYI